MYKRQVDIDGGAIDGTSIGSSSTSSGAFTTLSASSTLGVTGATTLTGALDANGGASIDNIQIGVTGNNEIDTSTGNLTIDSAGGTTTLDDAVSISSTLGVTGDASVSTFDSSGTTQLATDGSNTTVGGSLGVTGSSTFTGAVTANGGACLLYTSPSPRDG